MSSQIWTKESKQLIYISLEDSLNNYGPFLVNNPTEMNEIINRYNSQGKIIISPKKIDYFSYKIPIFQENQINKVSIGGINNGILLLNAQIKSSTNQSEITQLFNQNLPANYNVVGEINIPAPRFTFLEDYLKYGFQIFPKEHQEYGPSLNACLNNLKKLLKMNK